MVAVRFSNRLCLSAVSALMAATLILPVGQAWSSEVTAAAIEYLPQSPVKMDFEKRVALNSRWDLGYYLFQRQEFGAAALEFEKIRQVLPNDASLLALIGS